MRKGSKKVKITPTDTTEEKVTRTRAPRGEVPVNLARETELRKLASRHGARRAQLVMRQKCGIISAPERIALLDAHLDFAAVKREQGFEMQAYDVLRDASDVARELLRGSETPDSLRTQLERLPSDMRRALTAPLAPAVVPVPEPILVLPVAEPVARAPRASRASVIASAATTSGRKPRRRLFSGA